VQLNNVMGEADLHPRGRRDARRHAHRLDDGADPAAHGGRDAHRPRQRRQRAHPQRAAVHLTALVDRAAPLGEAVRAPRLHWDRRVLQVEPGLGPEVLAALRPGREVHEWAARDLYFGGVHAVSRDAGGAVQAVGDARRAGVGLVVGPQ
jgi:gamma-glutamyltranspeptidase/glutathione hydrolase